MSILKEGTLLNREQYKILKKIAQGGYGITYLAEEIGYYKNTGFGEEYKIIDKPEVIVIKEMFYDYCYRNPDSNSVTITNELKKTEYEKLVENQLEEGKKIKKLNHPNIVKTRDIFKDNNTSYMVMDYIKGLDLGSLLKKFGSLDKDKSLRYILQVLDAVDYFHTKTEQPLLHLDIKPSNIVIDEITDRAILIDFGQAISFNKSTKKREIITKNYEHALTPGYSPFEQTDLDQLKEFDATFDTYAIGATLYHMLTGQIPPSDVWLRNNPKAQLPPSEFGKDKSISDYLDAVIIKAKSTNYHDRYKSASELTHALTKENEYKTKIADINKLLASDNYQEANLEIDKIKNFFMHTPSILELEKIIKNHYDEDKNQREFQFNFDQGLELLANDKYQLAITFFEKALSVFPSNISVQEKINFCNEKLIEAKTNEIIFKIDNFINNNQNEEAKKLLNDLKEIAPQNPNIIILENRILQIQNNNIENNFKMALDAFHKNNFDKALQVVNHILIINKDHSKSLELKNKIEKEIEKTKPTYNKEVVYIYHKDYPVNNSQSDIPFEIWETEILKYKNLKKLYIYCNVTVTNDFLKTLKDLCNIPIDVFFNDEYFCKKNPPLPNEADFIFSTLKFRLKDDKISDSQKYKECKILLEKLKKSKHYSKKLMVNFDEVTLLEERVNALKPKFSTKYLYYVLLFIVITSTIWFVFNRSINKIEPNPNPAIDSIVVAKSDSLSKTIKQDNVSSSKINTSLPNKLSEKKIKELKDEKQEPSIEQPKEIIKQVNNVDESKYMLYLNRANEIIEKTGGCEECKKEIDKACLNSVTNLLNKALIYNPNGKEAKEILKCIKQ